MEVKTLNEKLFRDHFKISPKIVQKYIKELKWTLENQIQITNKAIAKIKQLENRNDELGLIIHSRNNQYRELKTKIRQLEDDLEEHNKDTNKVVAENQRLREAIGLALEFHVSSSLADNVNNLTLLRNKLQKALEDKDG